MSHKFPLTEDSDDTVEAEKALNAVLERGPTRRFRKERERALSHTPKSALLSLLITKEYASRQTRQLLDATLSQLSESTRRITLAESADTPQTRYTSELSPQLSAKVLKSLNEAQDAAARAQNNVTAYKLQLEEAQREIFRAQEALRVVERQRDEAERKAAEARETARQIREEQLFIMAREEGRRDGFDDGFEHGKELARAQKERRRAIDAQRRRSRRKMIEEAQPEPTVQATPASEAPLPVPPPLNQRDAPPQYREPTPEPPPPAPEVIPQVMNLEPPPPRQQPHFVTERPSSAASRSTRSSLRRQPAFERIQEQSPDVFQSHSPRHNSNELVSFPTQPSITSSQLGPEVTPTPAARPSSQEANSMPEPIVMPRPMPRERPRSTSSDAVPPPGMISMQRSSSVASSTPRARPASAASMTPPVVPPPGMMITTPVPSRPSSASGVSARMPYLRMPEPPPSVTRSSSGSSRANSINASSFGTAPPPAVSAEPSSHRSSSGRSSSYGAAPPPPVMFSEPPRQPSRGSQRHSSSSYSTSYGTAPPPPPMVPSDVGYSHSHRTSSGAGSSVHSSTFGTAPPPPPMEPIPRQPSRGSSGSRSNPTTIYANVPPSNPQSEYIPHRTRTSSLSSTGSLQRPYSRPGTGSDAGEPPTPSSTATGFSHLELMNFPNPAVEYTNNNRRERRESLRDRDRDRYINQLTAIPEHLTGSSQASRSPLNQPFIPPMPSSPHSVFDPTLQPPPMSAQSWSSGPTAPTPSSISYSVLQGGERESINWGHGGPSTPPGGATPEIIVTPEQEQIRYVPPPLNLEQDNFLGPSSARRGLYMSNQDSTNSIDSHRLSTSSTGSVEITIQPPSRPESIIGGSRPPSVTGHGYLSPNSASMPLPAPSNPQPAPVIPTEGTGNLPWGFVPVAVTPSQQPTGLYNAASSGPTTSNRPYSPYAPAISSSSEAPVIPSMEGKSKPRSQGRARASSSAQRQSAYAVAPTPPGFSYPAPLEATTPGAGAYLMTLPKRRESTSETESTGGSESDGELDIRVIPPPNTRSCYLILSVSHQEHGASNNLESVLECFMRGPLLSTIAKGTAFETRSVRILAESLAMELHRVGGRNDGGVDLAGWWHLPDSESRGLPKRIRIIAQCKAEKQKIGPKYIREMEGVLHEHIRKTRSAGLEAFSSIPFNTPEPFNESEYLKTQFPLVALFVSESAFSKSAILRMLSSSIPFLLLHLPPVLDPPDIAEEDSVPIGSALVNPALAGTNGVFRGQAEVRWEWCSRNGEGQPSVWVGGVKLDGHKTQV